MINSIVKNVADALSTHNITLTIDTVLDDEVFVTVEKEKLAYELFLTSDYASLSETKFSLDIGYDADMIFEVQNYELETLVNKISQFIDDEIESCRKENLMTAEDF